jgi:hypothetical protein
MRGDAGQSSTIQPEKDGPLRSGLHQVRSWRHDNMLYSLHAPRCALIKEAGLPAINRHSPIRRDASFAKRGICSPICSASMACRTKRREFNKAIPSESPPVDFSPGRYAPGLFL